MVDKKVTNIKDWGTPVNRKSDGEPPDMIEARVAKLESDVEFIKRDLSEVKLDLKDHRRDAHNDFKFLIVFGIAATTGLASMMAKGFGWL